MYWFLLKSIMSAIIGSSFYQWWQSTKMGIWFQEHVDAFMQYLAVKFDIEIAKKDAKFRKQYPLIADRLVNIEVDRPQWSVYKNQIKNLEDRINTHQLQIDKIYERILKLEAQIENRHM